MAWTYGGVTLHVQQYSREETDLAMAEHRLIADPAADHDTTPSSVLMGGGRSRIRRRVQGWVDASDFATLRANKHDAASATLTLAGGDTMTCIIAELSGALDVKRGDTVWFAATFVEV